MFAILKPQWHQPFLLWDCHSKTILKLILMTTWGKMKGGAICYTNVLGIFFVPHCAREYMA